MKQRSVLNLTGSSLTGLLLAIALQFGLALDAGAQVLTTAKPLPTRSWSLGINPAYHADGNTILFEGGGPAIGVSGGYSLQYDVDLGAKFIYFVNGPDYFGADIQWMVSERRRSYFSVLAGLHYWDYFGCDMTGLFTYNPRFEWNFSVGLDFDLSFYEVVNPRFWVPLSVGYMLNKEIFLYAEYNMPVSERSWDIFALGFNYIIR